MTVVFKLHPQRAWVLEDMYGEMMIKLDSGEIFKVNREAAAAVENTAYKMAFDILDDEDLVLKRGKYFDRR